MAYPGVPPVISLMDPLSLETLTIRGCALRRNNGKTAWVVGPSSEHVGFHCPAHSLQIGCDRPGVGVIVDRSVVDQHVAPAERGGQPTGHGADARRVADVELTGEHIPLPVRSISRAARSRLRQISCGERDGVATVGELSADFSP